MSDVDQVQIECSEDRVVIVLSGQLTASVAFLAKSPHKVPGAPDTSYTLIKIIREFPDICLDLSKVTAIKGTWGGIIRQLNDAHQERHGTPIRITKQSEAVRKYFAISGLNSIWPANNT